MGNYIVTGGNRGIGYYLTEGLLEGGHAVAVLDRELDGLAPLAARFPGRLWPLLCDVSREEEVARSEMCIRDSPLQRVGSAGTYVLVLQDALNALGLSLIHI